MKNAVDGLQDPLFPEYTPQVSAESNLEEYPLFELKARKNKTLSRTFERVIHGEGDIQLHQTWKVMPSSEYGMPGPVDQDVYLGVLQLLQQRGGMPDDGELRFSLYELRKLLGWSDDSAKAYRLLRESLLRIATTSVQSINAFYSAEDEQRLDDTFTVWSVHLSKREKRGKSVRERHKLRFHPIFIKNYLAQYLKGLDAEFFWSLRSAVSKRLYRLIDYERHGGLLWEADLFNLRDQLPLADYQYASEIKRALKNAHGELQDRGFLSSVVYEGKTAVRYDVSADFARKQKARELAGSPEEMFTIERLVHEGVWGNVARDLVAQKGAVLCNYYLEALPCQKGIEHPGAWLKWAIANEAEVSSPPSRAEPLFAAGRQAEPELEAPALLIRPEPEPAAAELWQQVLDDVAAQTDTSTFKVWFEGAVPTGLHKQTLTLSVPNAYAREYIGERFKDHIEGALQRCIGGTASLALDVWSQD